MFILNFKRAGENYIELLHDPVVCWESVHTGLQEALAKYFGTCESVVKHRHFKKLFCKITINHTKNKGNKY